LVLLSLAAAVVLASGHLVINEILPDPPGADAGAEFVEILNHGVHDVDMLGVALEFANGAEGPVWRGRWQCTERVVLPPGGRFLLVDRTWAGDVPGDAEATLGLQNGPDAVRLVRGDTVLDLVGYGALTDPAMFEGAPVPLEPGRALARRPDGADTGDNGADFVTADPTPGVPNFHPWAVSALSVVLDPPSLLRPGDEVLVTAELVNSGTEAWPPGSAGLAVGEAVVHVGLDAWSSGAVRTVAAFLRPASIGGLALRFMARPGGAPDSVLVPLGRIQVGAGPLVINEVLAAPAAGQGEWFELLAASAHAVPLAGWSVRDEDGPWLALPEVVVPAAGLWLAAQDSAALVDWLSDVAGQGGTTPCTDADGAPLPAGLASWPSLNNTPSGDRIFADRLLLRAPDGTVVDHVTIGAPGGPDVPGRSLERTSVGAWGPVGLPWAVSPAAPGATPGCPNAAALLQDVPEGRLDLVPAVLADGGAVHALFRLAGHERGWRLRVFDLRGRAVRDFGGDDLGAGPRDVLWDGTDDAGRRLPRGGYVFALEITDAGGGLRTARSLCGVR
jgi:hypothetical protein